MESNLFGHKLKDLRSNAKMGSRELSRLIGKTDTYVSQVERGQIKKPEFKTGYVMLKCIGLDEEKILEILDDYGIRLSSTLEYKQAKSFFIPSNSAIKNQMDWFNEESHEFKDLIQRISEILTNFVEKDLTRSKTVVSNLYHLINTDKNNFDFFCMLFEQDYTKINSNSKSNIIARITDISKMTETQNQPK